MSLKSIWARLNVQLLVTQAVAWLPSLLSAILIFIGFWVLYRITRPAVDRILARAGLDMALVGLLENLYKFTVMTFGVIMAVNQLGINVGAALAGLGVVGLTIGFAAKDTLSNVMAGFLIFWDKPFHSGDWITLGGNYGKVTDITMRTTRLVTSNNTAVIIPNGTVINQILVNHSARGKSRIEVPVAMALSGDLEKTRQAIVDAVLKAPGVLREPPPSVIVKALSGSSVDLAVRAWVANAEEEQPVFSRILELSKPVLDNKV